MISNRKFILNELARKQREEIEDPNTGEKRRDLLYGTFPCFFWNLSRFSPAKLPLLEIRLRDEEDELLARKENIRKDPKFIAIFEKSLSDEQDEIYDVDIQRLNRLLTALSMELDERERREN